MSVMDMLFKLGVGTWVTDIITPVPTVAATTFQIGKILPTDIGFIYGLSTYVDQVDPDNNALITETNARVIYLTLQDGPTQFLSQLRMSDLIVDFGPAAASTSVRNDRYMPVNIPAFDLSKSYFQNPTSIAAGTIRLKVWYVQKNDWASIKSQFTIPKR